MSLHGYEPSELIEMARTLAQCRITQGDYRPSMLLHDPEAFLVFAEDYRDDAMGFVIDEEHFVRHQGVTKDRVYFKVDGMTIEAFLSPEYKARLREVTGPTPADLRDDAADSALERRRDLS